VFQQVTICNYSAFTSIQTCLDTISASHGQAACQSREPRPATDQKLTCKLFIDAHFKVLSDGIVDYYLVLDTCTLARLLRSVRETNAYGCLWTRRCTVARQSVTLRLSDSPMYLKAIRADSTSSSATTVAIAATSRSC
jgi:hypothetical protein